MAKSKDPRVAKSVDGSRFELVRGDITKQETEAVVNAANKRLAPGGGVAGAIHRAAGDQLWEECKGLGGCETGEAKITEGYELSANYVIHTVGPVYSDSPEKPKLLESSYRNSLELARENGIESVSFPALSTGAFGYPEREAGRIAIKTIIDFLTNYSQPELVRLVLYGKSSFDLHRELLSDIQED
ncbi:macro domain-containing protein [Candidatus Bipolaricaulota bacterium]|nr:macro domain-containing protein [Candidatus Bipolaricaulota bacterium]